MMTDDEKHAWARKRGYPHAVFLTKHQYEAAADAGLDMNNYVIQKPIPLAPDAMFIEHKMPSSAEMRAEIDRKIAAGEPLGASHVQEFPLGHFVVVGSISKFPEYAPIEARVLAHMGSADDPYAALAAAYYKPSDKPKWPCRGLSPTGRKAPGTGRQCGGKEIACLPGKSGACVACSDED